MLENLVNKFDLKKKKKPFSWKGEVSFPQIPFLNLIEISFKERVIFPSDVRYSWSLGIFRKFPFPVVMDSWGGYIF